MVGFQQSNEARPVLTAATVFLCTGLCIALLFLRMGLGEFLTWSWDAAMAMTSSLIFLCACVLVFFRRTLGYALGWIAGVVALPWFILTESSSRRLSVWMYLNGPDDFAGINLLPYAVEKILSVAFIAAAVTCCILRLLPPGLLLRNSPLSRRTWPAIAVAVLVLALWLHHSATPWMLPEIVDEVPPELRILHVEKRGLQFHETAVTSMRDGRFRFSQYDRRLLQYRFQSRSTAGRMPPSVTDRANVLAHSTTLRNVRTALPIALRTWDAEGWYVAGRNLPILAFTSEYGTTPPQEIRDLLEQIGKLAGTQQQVSFAVEDVCLGFCYDPVAGLGFWYSNQRCHGMPDGTTQCF
jgi:hypothetical protein